MSEVEVKRLSSVKGKTLQRVLSVAWNANGSLLASASMDMGIKLWSVGRTGQTREVRELKGHRNPVEQVRWARSDSNKLVSASEDKTVKLWDTRAGRCANTWDTAGPNLNLAFHPNETQIAVGDRDDLVSLIDLRQGGIVDSVNFHSLADAQINQMSWNPDGTHLFLTAGMSSVGRGGIKVLDTSGGKLERVAALDAHTANCLALQFSPDGAWFALGSTDALLSLWDARELCTVQTFTLSETQLRSASFSGDGRFIAYGSLDRSIAVVEVPSGRKITMVDCSMVDGINAVAWHPVEPILAFCGEEPKGTRGGFVRVIGANFV
ncbi:WD repeat-containing protein AAC3 [Hondaea fermentalgiana]|uniref:WD repeat-containing protein AAC3 n=1 Tax=Hondaea fermentalgiana TaxID=2315210 RepID=A0A2R5GUX2_9STRA|nr:WD repeat-containing protein AAC3 [Hondaea fermentalgiana]|eukprot:GBG32191.1 WD repeat-containing protein AAC3 [Hondaea fermentalgiana]